MSTSLTSCHLAPTDHPNQKRNLKKKKKKINIYFNIISHLTSYSRHWHWHLLLYWHLWQRHLQLIRKLRGLMDKTFVSLLTEKLRLEYVRSSWQNNHSKTLFYINQFSLYRKNSTKFFFYLDVFVFFGQSGFFFFFFFWPSCLFLYIRFFFFVFCLGSSPKPHIFAEIYMKII